MTKPLNGMKLIALVPMFVGERIDGYYAVVQRDHAYDPFIVVWTKDPTAHEWGYSVDYHANLAAAMASFYQHTYRLISG